MKTLRILTSVLAFSLVVGGCMPVLAWNPFEGMGTSLYNRAANCGSSLKAFGSGALSSANGNKLVTAGIAVLGIASLYAGYRYFFPSLSEYEKLKQELSRVEKQIAALKIIAQRSTAQKKQLNDLDKKKKQIIDRLNDLLTPERETAGCLEAPAKPKAKKVKVNLNNQGNSNVNNLGSSNAATASTSALVTQPAAPYSLQGELNKRGLALG